MISQFWGAQAASLQVSAACRDQLIACNTLGCEICCRQQQASSLRSPDPLATPVVKSLFLAFDVPILNHLDTLQRHHSAAHHFLQCG